MIVEFYGMQAPVGSVALLFVDGATRDKAGKPAWILLIAEYGGWDANYRQELLAMAKPKEGTPAFALLGSVVELARQVHSQLAKASRNRRATPRLSEEQIARLVNSAIYLGSDPEWPDSVIREGGIPGCVIFVNRAKKLFATTATIGVGMPMNLYEAIYPDALCR